MIGAFPKLKKSFNWRRLAAFFVTTGCAYATAELGLSPEIAAPVCGAVAGWLVPAKKKPEPE